MRRPILLLLVVVAVATLAVAARTVLAASVQCAGHCVGTREDDTLNGGQGNERIAGLEGNDIISGHSGDDVLFGDEGNDYIEDIGHATSDEDEIYGDEGNDTIHVQDFGPDFVNCGPGTKDKVFFDVGIDEIKGCERKNPGA